MYEFLVITSVDEDELRECEHAASIWFDDQVTNVCYSDLNKQYAFMVLLSKEDTIAIRQLRRYCNEHAVCWNRFRVGE